MGLTASCWDMSVSDLYIAFRVFRMAGWALLAETVLLLGLTAYHHRSMIEPG